ncbi:acetoacetyl-coenzyme A synthetase [Caerostris extrusa]|uniref:Acetoacetyl-coenzyme A synthetase n=1 Tax=Caerostris extrusa TaxID=172846 RepID=A0AAV4XDH8_CAEEX|nr:acetoacetyl-coenzyme A synthetase [Caerostris extrusa]
MLLEDFLQSGKHSDGTLPELVFEQLPFDHPIAINFTSGTTGLPKGVLHSAGTFIAVLRDFGLHLNLRNGDTVYTYCPVSRLECVGQSIPSLALGVKLFLSVEAPSSQRKVSPCGIACPKPGMNFDSLKVVALGASPSKIRNFEFLHNRVNKNLFVSSIYGATEVFGAFSGFDLNLPSYSSECQVPSLGVDLHVFDDFGTSVVGKRGEMVVTTPTPSFPVYLWNDKNNAKLKETYFSKYEVDKMEELQDFICVGQDRWNGETRAVLFVKMRKGYEFTEELKEKIAETIKREVSDDYIPKLMLEIPDVPYNLNHKRMESTIKKILATNAIPEVSNIKNRESLQYYLNIPEVLSYNEK